MINLFIDIYLPHSVTYSKRTWYQPINDIYVLNIAMKLSSCTGIHLNWRRNSKKQDGNAEYRMLVYTTQVNSAFRALWLVHSEVISQHYSPPRNRRERFLNFRPLFTLKITFWSANYSACVVYTKTIIHLSVGESDGYLPSRFAAR